MYDADKTHNLGYESSKQLARRLSSAATMESQTQGNEISQKVRIAVIDDHELLRAALKQLLDDDPGLEACGEADEADDGFRLVCDTQPDLVVVDVSLKHGDGLDLVKRIHDRHPHIRTIVLSMYDPELFAERALRAGAQGYVNKQQPTEDLVTAIRTVLSGDVYLDEAMTREVLRRSRSGIPAPARSRTESLSDRELEIFRFIGRGLTTQEIAKELHIATSTVETYRERLKTKLNTHSGAGLTRSAVQWVLEHG